MFDNDYVRHHITLGYAITVHSAQGVTADTTHAVIGETASRAIAYVAMSRGRDTNQAYIYRREPGEGDREHHRLLDAAEVHRMRRGNKNAAAHCLRMILTNDDRPHTTHTYAERTARDQLPPVIANALARNDQRRTARRDAWRHYVGAERARSAAYQHIISRDRNCDLSTDGYGLEL